MTTIKIKKEKIARKGKLKFENYTNVLERTQPENKINHLEKSETDICILKKYQ